MKRLEFYEFSGIVAPGVMATIFILAIFLGPDEILSINFGSTLILLVGSYVLGHLVQAVGNVFEMGYWFFWKGMPTDWVQKKADPILSERQRNVLLERLQERNDLPDGFENDMSRKEWFRLVRLIYTVVEKKSHIDRTERFNAYYGLMRGTAIVFMGSVVYGFFLDDLVLIIPLIVCFVLTVYRMHRFARYYARELFLQYISIDGT